jgi:hypothetical protein
MRVFYRNHPAIVTFVGDRAHTLSIGKVTLTDVGKDLIRVCDREEVDGFFEYVTDKWNRGDTTAVPV